MSIEEGDEVMFDGEKYTVTKVWHHGLKWYDLEAVSDLLGSGYKKVQLSVPEYEITPLTPNQKQ